MKTTTFQAVLNGAAEYTGRTSDKIPVKEQTMLQRYLAAEFRKLLRRRAWADCTAFYNATAANRQFSKNEGSVDPAKPELGDILCVMTADPRAGRRRWRGHCVDFTEESGVVLVETDKTSLWVEYMLPYPGVVFPNLTPETMTLAAFYAATLPLEFEDALAHMAAARLLGADGNPAGAGVEMGLANAALVDEINAQPAEPWWRCQAVLAHRNE
jgi:hypothetical protein